MAKTNPIGIRFEPETKAALDQAAKAEGRSLANLIGRILAAWLRDRGLLKCVPLVLGVALLGPQPVLAAAPQMTMGQAEFVAQKVWEACIRQNFLAAAKAAHSRGETSRDLVAEQAFLACTSEEGLIYQTNPEARQAISTMKQRIKYAPSDR